MLIIQSRHRNQVKHILILLDGTNIQMGQEHLGTQVQLISGHILQIRLCMLCGEKTTHV